MIMNKPPIDRTLLSNNYNSQRSLIIAGSGLNGSSKDNSCRSLLSISSNTTARGGVGGFAEVSLSNIFANEEEDINIFVENSLVLVQCIAEFQSDTNAEAVLQNRHQRSPTTQRNGNLMKSLKTVCSNSTWQGSCNSFMGSDDELLDLSFTITDFDKGHDSLSLEAKPIQKEILRNDKAFNNCKTNSIATTKKSIIPGTSRMIRGSNINSFTTGGMHSFDETLRHRSPDAAPRQPVRRRESPTASDGSSNNRGHQIKHGMEITKHLVKTPFLCNDDESCSSEVIKFNLVPPSRMEHVDSNSCPLPSIHDTHPLLQRQPSTCSSQLSSGSKEDVSPKRPCRGASPTRTVTEELQKSVTQNANSIQDGDIRQPKSGSPPKDLVMSSPSTAEGKSINGGIAATSPRKKVTKIAIKDLGNYVSNVPDSNGKSQNAGISPLKYRKILKAAVSKLINSPTNVKTSLEDVNHTQASTRFIKPPIPMSVAVDCTDRSVSSIDDSSRSFNRDRSNGMFKKSMSNRNMSNAHVAIISPTLRYVATNSTTTSSAKLTQNFSRGKSCRALTTSTDNNYSEYNTDLTSKSNREGMSNSHSAIISPTLRNATPNAKTASPTKPPRTFSTGMSCGALATFTDGKSNTLLNSNNHREGISNSHGAIISPTMCDVTTNASIAASPRKPANQFLRGMSCRAFITSPENTSNAVLAHKNSHEEATPPPSGSGLPKKRMTRSNSCHIGIDGSTEQQRLNRRYDTPIIRPTLDEYFPRVTTPTPATKATAMIISTASPQKTKEEQFVIHNGIGGGRCRDRPPTSPRRSISPSKRLSLYTNH